MPIRPGDTPSEDRHPGLRAWAPLKGGERERVGREGVRHPGLRAWAPLKDVAATYNPTTGASSPRSTGLGSVEGAGRRSSHRAMTGHPGLRAWAPLKAGNRTATITGPGRHPGLRAWAPLKVVGQLRHDQGGSRHPGLRAWAPLKLACRRTPRPPGRAVTQVYGPGLR